jgi:hypothetical protein
MSRTEETVTLPVPVGERIVSTPFEHRGVVGEGSSASICRVILDEPLPHTNRVLSQWSEIHREADYDLAEQARYVEWAVRDLAAANASLLHAKKKVEKARADLREERAKLREAKARRDAA